MSLILGYHLTLSTAHTSAASKQTQIHITVDSRGYKVSHVLDIWLFKMQKWFLLLTSSSPWPFPLSISFMDHPSMPSLMYIFCLSLAFSSTKKSSRVMIFSTADVSTVLHKFIKTYFHNISLRSLSFFSTVDACTSVFYSWNINFWWLF